VAEETAAALGTPAVLKISKDLQALVDGIVRKSEIASRANGDYVSTVVMPGTLLDTNAEEVKGNSVVWRFSDRHLSIADYEMRVDSRSVNVWPMAVTGLVVLLLIFLPVGIRRWQEREFMLKNA